MEAGISVPDTDIFIKKYTHQRITLNTSEHSNSVVISPESIIHDEWPLQALNQLTTEMLASLFKNPADVYLIGTGQRQQFPAMPIYQYCRDSFKAVDFMNSQAACRTFNILASEGRSVIAAIILEN